MPPLPPLVSLLIILLAVHIAIDIQFQSDFVAINKNRRLNKTPVPWYYVMTSHCDCHALAVGYFLGFWYGVAEFAAHFVIDVLKCEGKTGIHTDQALHALCKLAWVLIFFYA